MAMRAVRLFQRGSKTLAACATGTACTALYLHGAEDEYRFIPESSLPQKYDPAEIAAVWREHPRCALARLSEIGRHAVPFLAGWAAEEAGVRIAGASSASLREVQYARRAARLRELLTALGPTFVKAGQMLSIRPDLLPPVAVYELQKLCDAVPSYPTAEALALIEQQLGAPAGLKRWAEL